MPLGYTLEGSTVFRTRKLWDSSTNPIASRGGGGCWEKHWVVGYVLPEGGGGHLLTMLTVDVFHRYMYIHPPGNRVQETRSSKVLPLIAHYFFWTVSVYLDAVIICLVPSGTTCSSASISQWIDLWRWREYKDARRIRMNITVTQHDTSNPQLPTASIYQRSFFPQQLSTWRLPSHFASYWVSVYCSMHISSLSHTEDRTSYGYSYLQIACYCRYYFIPDYCTTVCCNRVSIDWLIAGCRRWFCTWL